MEPFNTIPLSMEGYLINTVVSDLEKGEKISLKNNEVENKQGKKRKREENVLSLDQREVPVHINGPNPVLKKVRLESSPDENQIKQAKHCSPPPSSLMNQVNTISNCCYGNVFLQSSPYQPALPMLPMYLCQNPFVNPLNSLSHHLLTRHSPQIPADLKALQAWTSVPSAKTLINEENRLAGKKVSKHVKPSNEDIIAVVKKVGKIKLQDLWKVHFPNSRYKSFWNKCNKLIIAKVLERSFGVEKRKIIYLSLNDLFIAQEKKLAEIEEKKHLENT